MKRLKNPLKRTLVMPGSFRTRGCWIDSVSAPTMLSMSIRSLPVISRKRPMLTCGGACMRAWMTENTVSCSLRPIVCILVSRWSGMNAWLKSSKTRASTKNGRTCDATDAVRWVRHAAPMRVKALTCLRYNMNYRPRRLFSPGIYATIVLKSGIVYIYIWEEIACTSFSIPMKSSPPAG